VSVPAVLAAATATAVTWLGFAWLTGYGLGPLVLLFAVGIGIVLRGADGAGGPLLGAAGAVVVVLVMLVGRAWLVARMERPAEGAVVAAAASDDDAMQLALAQQIAQQQLDTGNPLELPGGRRLPEGVAVIEFAGRNEVPDDIWQQAERLWQATSEEQRATHVERRRQFVAQARAAGAPQGFAARFGISGLFWTVIAAGAAFLIGSRTAA